VEERGTSSAREGGLSANGGCNFGVRSPSPLRNYGSERSSVGLVVGGECSNRESSQVPRCASDERKKSNADSIGDIMGGGAAWPKGWAGNRGESGGRWGFG